MRENKKYKAEQRRFSDLGFQRSHQATEWGFPIII